MAKKEEQFPTDLIERIIELSATEFPFDIAKMLGVGDDLVRIILKAADIGTKANRYAPPKEAKMRDYIVGIKIVEVALVKADGMLNAKFVANGIVEREYNSNAEIAWIQEL